jgi:hypothetical protein
MKKLLFGLCVLFAVASAQAQQALKGLREFRVVIEDLDGNAKACGITASLINTSLRFVIQQSKIRLTESYGRPWIYIRVSVLSPQLGFCTYSTEMTVTAKIFVQESTESGWGKIWDKVVLSMYAISDTPKMVSATVESLAKQLVVDWATVNP